MRLTRALRIPLVLIATLGLAGCSPPAPVALARQGDALVVAYLACDRKLATELLITVNDENGTYGTLLWHLVKRQRDAAMPKFVTLGVVPPGFAERVSWDPASGDTREVVVVLREGEAEWSPIFYDVHELRSGDSITSDGDRRGLQEVADADCQ
jgi:hypothetical protein